MHETIAVAMSGGVDSSVAAWLLREQGHALLGLTMALFPGCQAGGLSDAAAVAAFYEAALAAGGTDNGAPGPRDYHPGYYAAFVYDPEGNNIEAVIHDWSE